MIESGFFSKQDQRDWLNNHNRLSNKDLIELVEVMHKQLVHDIFIDPVTTDEGKEDNRRRNETVEDLATILSSRGTLPPQFEAYALDPQDLPWMPKETHILPSKLSND